MKNETPKTDKTLLEAETPLIKNFVQSDVMSSVLPDAQHYWSQHYDMENKLDYWICLNCGDKSKTYSTPVTCGKTDY